jgi:hypothetical protein
LPVLDADLRNILRKSARINPYKFNGTGLPGRNQIGRLTYALKGETVPQGEGERLDELLSQPSARPFE